MDGLYVYIRIQHYASVVQRLDASQWSPTEHTASVSSGSGGVGNSLPKCTSFSSSASVLLSSSGGMPLNAWLLDSIGLQESWLFYTGCRENEWEIKEQQNSIKQCMHACEHTHLDLCVYVAQYVRVCMNICVSLIIILTLLIFSRKHPMHQLKLGFL